MLKTLLIALILVACQRQTTPDSKVEAIDQELQTLNEQLQNLRIAELNTAISTEYQMRGEENIFVGGLKKAEQDQNEAQKIEKRIEELLEQKRKLINGS